MHDREPQLDKLTELSRKLKVLSEEVARIEDAQNIQVKLDREKPIFKGIKVKEISMISEAEITEDGTKKRVVRHDPNNLAQALVELILERDR